jgi:hypothetical protein
MRRAGGAGRNAARVVLALGLAACGPTRAERLVAAHHAPDFEGALAACAEFDPDCAQAAVERFGRWDACDRVPDPEECHFRDADRLGLAGDFAGALSACRSAGAYVMECNQHILGLLAEGPATLVDAEAAFAAVEAEVAMRRGRGQFLRMWFRARAARGEALPVDDCTDDVCRNAGTHVRGDQPAP